MFMRIQGWEDVKSFLGQLDDEVVIFFRNFVTGRAFFLGSQFIIMA